MVAPKFSRIVSPYLFRNASTGSLPAKISAPRRSIVSLLSIKLTTPNPNVSLTNSVPNSLRLNSLSASGETKDIKDCKGSAPSTTAAAADITDFSKPLTNLAPANPAPINSKGKPPLTPLKSDQVAFVLPVNLLT